MTLLGRRDSGQHGVDPVPGLDRIARHVEVHQRRMAVVGHRALALERRLHVLHVRHLGQARRHVLHRGPELRILDGEPVALDEHDLRLRTKACVFESDLGVMRLAVEVVYVGDGVEPHRLPDGEGENYEGEPTEERLLPVTAAPARHPGGQIVRRRMRVHKAFLLLVMRQAVTPAGTSNQTQVPAGAGLTPQRSAI